MKIHKSCLQAVAILLAIGVAGCASNAQIVETPTVHLSGVEASDLSLKGQTFILSFDVSNPNPFPLRIRTVSYRVQLEKQRFAGGELDCDFSIPAGSNGSFAISVKLDILRSASRLSAILRSGMGEPVGYELNGRLTIDIPLVKPLPFSHSGVISIAAN